MATRLYFRVATNATSGLPTSEQSSLTADVNAEAQTVNRTLSTTKGTSQTSIANSTAGTRSVNTNFYYTKFVSDALNMSSIAANTWTYNFAASEANANSQFPGNGNSQPVRVNCYVWRPSGSTKVGTILDGNTGSTYNEPASINTEISEHGTFTGSSVASMVSGDVIILEVWFIINQTTTSATAKTFFFDGGTETTNTGTTVSDHAAFLETPEDLTFAGAAAPVNQSIFIEWQEET